MTIQAVTAQEMYEYSENCDLIFFWNRHLVSKLIEDITDGPSHVGMVVRPKEDTSQPYFIEAVWPAGTRLRPLARPGGSDGKMVLVRRVRPADTLAKDEILEAAYKTLGIPYEVKEELEIALHRLLAAVKVQKYSGEYFCSGAVHHWFESAPAYVFGQPSEGNATPAYLWNACRDQAILQSVV